MSGAATEPTISIDGRVIGGAASPYVIAEISANHGGSLDRALDLISAAHAAGADAVKLQTYTPDTMTIDAATPPFRVGVGTIWEGRALYDLYAEAMTPWEWHTTIAERCAELGITWFSTPFDESAVAFLDELDVPAFKIASFELVDLPLVRAVAARGKPMLMSTGMATMREIDEAVAAARDAGATELALLRCNSAYPASPSEMDLRTIPHMRETWHVPVGLSDHTLGQASATVAVALGACILEKHVTARRADGGPDSSFSLEPEELAGLVVAMREAHAALGGVRYGPTETERPSLAFRRSLFVVADVEKGERFAASSVRSIRPAGGLPPAALLTILGRRAARRIERGTPLTWDLVD